MKISFIYILIISSAFCQNIFPILGGQRVGTSVFSFLNIGISARAIGMGESVVALNQDASSVFYNPATIAQLDQTEIYFTQIQWPAEISYDFFSITKNIKGRHYFGLNGGILHMEPMMETTEFFPDGTGNYFTYQDQFVGLTYGAKMTDRFSFGLTIKQVSENLAGFEMSTFLFDMGTFYWTGYKSLRFCASISHFGSQTGPNGSFEKLILDQESGVEINEQTEFEKFSPPTLFRVGGAIDPLLNDKHMLTISSQLNHPVDNAEYIVFGLEYSFLKTFYLRGGYKFNKLEENRTLGLGLLIPLSSFKVRVDYGYANFDHLTDPKRFSLGISI